MSPRSELRLTVAAELGVHTRDAVLASIVDLSDDAIIAKSPEGTVTFWNRGAERMFGYSAGEMIGKSVQHLIHVDRQSEMDLIIARIRNGERVEHHETVRVRKDGSAIAISLTVSPTLDGSGTLLGISSIARDISERKRSEDLACEASSYARSLIEASLDPLLTISADGKVSDANEATFKVTGVRRERLIGTEFSHYFTEPERARGGYLEAFASGFVTDLLLTVRHRRGQLTELVFNVSVYKDRHGDALGVFAAARSVTAKKNTEAQVGKELERLVELERFKKLTVGRELKMIDLKRELAELKQELASLKAIPATVRLEDA